MGGMGGGAGGGEIFGALMGAGQSIGEGIFASKEAKKARAWQKKLLKEGPKWQRMGMEAAGLNPILPFLSGKGISSGGGGAVPLAHQVRGGNATAGVRDIATARREGTTAKRMNTLMDLEAKKITQEIATLVQQEHRNFNEGMKLGFESELRQLQIPGAKVDMAIDVSPYGRTMKKADRLRGAATSAADISNTVRRSITGFGRR